MKQEDHEALKGRLLAILTRHVGHEKAVDMGALFEQVFGREWHNKINDTRELRTLITEARDEGVPICSVSRQQGGGYYLAAVDSELQDYLKRLRGRALRALQREARLRRQSLPELLGQMQLECL